MKDTSYKICSLLLLHARDSYDICKELLQQIDVPRCDSICVDDPLSSVHPAFQNPNKTRIQIVFFSPGFLNFLECKPEEAFVTFRYMDPGSALALFCRGLREQQIMCYHMAPLNSYNSWPKFEVANTIEKGIEFPESLLQTIQDLFPSNVSSVNGIMVVPKLINKDSNKVCIIFPDAIQDMSSISVYLESEGRIQVIPENMNPYVIYFTVPGTLMDVCHKIGVKIQQSCRLLAEEELLVVQDSTNRRRIKRQKSFPKYEKSMGEQELDEQLRLLSEMTHTPDFEQDDETMTMCSQEEETTRSLINLCRKYGLEELTPYINETDSPHQPDYIDHQIENQGAREANRLNNRSYTVNANFDDEDEDTCGSPVKRSLSLPSLLHPIDDSNSIYGEYLEMAAVANRNPYMLPDHHSIDDDNVSCSVSSNGYVYMEWQDRDSVDSLEMLKRGLSISQQELLEIMMAFKRGERTISDVEVQFQSWNRRHDRRDQKVHKSSMSFIPGLRTLMQRKPNKTLINGNEEDRRSSRSSDLSSRKTSNESTTSTRSTASDASSITLHSLNPNRKHSQETARAVSTGWIPTHTTTKMYPLLPDAQPPPLPPKPSSQYNSEEKPKLHPRKITLPKRVLHPSVTGELELDDDPEHLDDNKNVQSFLQFLEEYGLQEIGDYFLRDYCSCSDTHLGHDATVLTSKSSHTVEDDDSHSRHYLNVPSFSMESESSLCVLRRSLSLPSTLCPTEANIDDRYNNLELEFPNHNGHECDKAADCIYDDCFPSTLCSNVYVSIKSRLEVDCAPDQPPPLEYLSNSQQELLELMHDFKRGKKTLTQVEQQFQGWHQRYMGTSSHREKELLQLKNQYEKAQKQTIFGLPNIKSFILRKPKKKSKVSSPDDSPVKQRNRKSETDSRRLSKISFTSTSSGVSDSSDVFRNICYFNPDYGNYKEGELSKNNSTSSNPSPKKVPPPLPPRYSLTPPACQLPDVVQENINVKYEDNVDLTHTDRSSSNNPKFRPCVPPKPLKLQENVDQGNNEENIEIKNHEGYLNPDDPNIKTPGSPDYIVPNRVRFVFPPQTPKKCYTEGTKFSPGSSKVSSGAKTAIQKRQLFKIPKSSKKEESMFYVTSRKWSSFPDLTAQLGPQPIYIELVDEQDYRSKSISDN